MREPYDVIVVGSGAGGGMSAYTLTAAGLTVLMLEAGRDYHPESETAMFALPSEAPLRDEPTPDKPWGYYSADIGGWEIPDEPYTTARNTEFRWYRARMLGGRTNHWARIALRFGPYDFKPYSRDGLGVDWPLTYDDLAPWYDRVERLIGVTGAREGLENSPDSPPEIPLPPPPLRPSEVFVKRGLESLGIPVAAVRAAILTRPFNGRPACLYATPCGRGCAIGANFQSPTVLVQPALASGRLSVRTHAFVYEVTVDKRGQATGVSFIDRTTGTHHAASARAVVLAASACESARVLLNSKSSLFPDGLANEGGLVGRYLTDSVGTGALGYFPALERLPPRNDDGISINHMYVPWWGYQQQVRGELDFPRGYHIEMGGGRGMPSMGGIGVLARISKFPYGPGLRRELCNKFGTLFGFGGRGEMIPNEETFCELDPKVKDKWGIPVLRFHWKWSDYEIRQAVHARRTFEAVIDRLGGKVLDFGAPSERPRISTGGEITHEVGTTRMGVSPRDSVVNQFGQSWSVRNLFVMDGGVFASHPNKNPTLSILALSWRSSAYLAEEARKGNLS